MPGSKDFIGGGFKLKASLLLILILVGVFSLYLMDNPLINSIFFPKYAGIVSVGFGAFEPIDEAVVYLADGRYKSTFVSVEETEARIDYVGLYETMSEQGCGSVEVNGVLYQGGYGSELVSPSARFVVSALCPGKTLGEPYEINITIRYTPLKVENNISREVNGRLRGPVEP